MAFQTNPIFRGFSGSVNRRIMFRQYAGKTVICKFPDRSRVVYSTKQKEEQNRFKDAVAFAKIVISHQVLKDSYSMKASELGFRSAWNMAIADFMSRGELTRKPRKIRFDKSLIRGRIGKRSHIRLFKRVDEPVPAIAGRSPDLCGALIS